MPSRLKYFNKLLQYIWLTSDVNEIEIFLTVIIDFNVIIYETSCVGEQIWIFHSNGVWRNSWIGRKYNGIYYLSEYEIIRGNPFVLIVCILLFMFDFLEKFPWTSLIIHFFRIYQIFSRNLLFSNKLNHKNLLQIY